MSDNKETNVEANSRDFKRGVAAGLNSEDTKHLQGGYKLGEELSDKATKEPVKEIIQKESDTPLFLKGTSDAHKGDAQDEKDKSAE